MVRIGKSVAERQQIEQMAAAIAAYRGPVTYCRPGIARGHEAITELHPNRANRTAPQSTATERSTP
jgi:hypothetical protein